MGIKKPTTTPFNTQRSIQRLADNRRSLQGHSLTSEGREYSWSNKMERVEVIREGIPFETIEVISQRLSVPVNSLLSLLGIPQTLYNKKKAEHSLMDRRDSELIVMISELIDHGLEVFNHEEEKFQRWLQKPNLSLGGKSPESMLDTMTGINEVKFCLNRLESGNLA
ncbi:MAG TPA: antitoxin Xre/MbcA/ParS toxin-binding domain-containing protein [Cyclobacteriaceae bacterium]|nr:antitoxin Xre/MbcA/ParS toxin-binding domain-containing protein [Cyclobacteriaceae bacterium]